MLFFLFFFLLLLLLLKYCTSCMWWHKDASENDTGRLCDGMETICIDLISPSCLWYQWTVLNQSHVIAKLSDFLKPFYSVQAQTSSAVKAIASSWWRLDLLQSWLESEPGLIAETGNVQGVYDDKCLFQIKKEYPDAL